MRRFRKQKGEGEDGCITFIMLAFVITVIILGVTIWMRNEKIRELESQPARHAVPATSTPAAIENISEEEQKQQEEVQKKQQEVQEKIENQYIQRRFGEMKLGENVAYIVLPCDNQMKNFDRTKMAIKFLTKFQQEKGVQVISWNFYENEGGICITFFKTADGKSEAKNDEKTENQIEAQAENQESNQELPKEEGK